MNATFRSRRKAVKIQVDDDEDEDVAEKLKLCEFPSPNNNKSFR